MDILRKATVEELAAVHEIGDVIAESVHDWLMSDYGTQVIDRLMSAGVSLKVSQTSEIRDGQLSGKTVVVTGTLESFTRQEAEAAIQKAGGQIILKCLKKHRLCCRRQ